MREIRYDDIDALKSQISDEFGPWGAEVAVTQDMIQAFADLTGDKQWIHTDVERAKKESPYGAPIAHGFLTLSLLSQMRPPTGFALIGYGNVTNYGANGLRFLAPVPSGSTIHARTRIANVEEHAKGTRIERETAVHVVDAERPSLIYAGLILYRHPRS